MPGELEPGAHKKPWPPKILQTGEYEIVLSMLAIYFLFLNFIIVLALKKDRKSVV